MRGNRPTQAFAYACTRAHTHALALAQAFAQAVTEARASLQA